ncbi:MAG: hypothetical protein K9G44_12915, partial [Melioribacteraceae bacterium]|nr:hypothetical protein [Melioribacteraceae bacterium]
MNERKISFIVICIASALQLFAQNNAKVYWSLSETDQQQPTSVEGNVIAFPQTSSQDFVVRDYKNGPGPDQRWWPFDGTSPISWGEDSTQNENRWVQFSLKPESNFTFSASEFNIYLGGKGTDGIRANVYSSTSSDFTNSYKLNNNEIILLKDTDSLYSFSLNHELKSTDTLFLRIYPWYTGSPSTSKYLYLREAEVSGISKGVTYPASATWELTDPNSAGTGLVPSTEGNVKAKNELLHNTEINQYTGANGSQRIRIAGNKWPSNQTEKIDSVYIQFEVAPKSGFNFYVTDISLKISAASINTMKAEIYYSTDPTFTNSVRYDFLMPDTINNYIYRDSLIHLSKQVYEPVLSSESFYLRIYPWVDNDPAERTGKYLLLQDVVIGGEIEGTPTFAQIIWPYIDDENAITTGALVPSNPGYSDGMKFYGFTDLPDSNSVSYHLGAIQTTSQSWLAETDITDSLYFQYAVSPKFGGTFFIDSVSMIIGGWFTKNIRAQIYYSKDESFSTKELLFSDFALPGNEVQKIGTSLNAAVESGETFYLRIYPYNTQEEGWAKLVAIDSVTIRGSTIGVTADPPNISTNSVSDISVTFAKSGGTISSDGGSPVTSRGIVWNTIGNPTITDYKSSDGEGSGSFISYATGLDAGTKYYLKAYATNDAGTSYGREYEFTTLDSLFVPTVITSSASNILVQSTDAGGQVTAWGGDSVTVRGVCWNATGNPGISDNKTENGTGLGSFNSVLYPLTKETKYYYRAYATNSSGTGYGKVDSFTTQSPAPNVFKVVAKDGSGDYETVQAAFNGVPDYYTGEYTIFVKKGTYYEKLFLDRKKVNVRLIGEDRDSTILTYDDYAGRAGGTSKSYSTAIEGDDFIAKNITFQNTVKNDGTFQDQQGVALMVNGDRQAYYNCNLLGYQDTYYTWGGRGTGRTYHKNSYIEGSVDFIFGRNIVLFDSCEININRDGGTLTAAATEPESKFGYVFRDCIITNDSLGFDGKVIDDFVLGRPWQKSPRTVFINCYQPAALSADGWSKWNVLPELYAEYNC